MDRKSIAAKQVPTLRYFVSTAQLAVICSGSRGEEGGFFFDKIAELYDTVTTMPETYEQDGKGDDAIVYLHYFNGGQDWYITERDMELNCQAQAFGFADLGSGSGEIGYISIEELKTNGVEIDLHWTPKTLREVKAA